MLKLPVAALAAAALLAACAPAGDLEVLPPPTDHHHPAALTWTSPAERPHALGSAAPLTAPDGQPFQRVGLRVDGPRPTLHARARLAEGWIPVDVALTFSEGELHVAVIHLPAPASALILEGAEGLSAGLIEFHPEALPPRVPAAQRPLDRPAPPGIGVLRQALAPADLAVRREVWGARQPDQICADVIAPYRMSVHHTASPDSDGADPAARMRQMQAFHMDSRGWCDIGYHFVISQGGTVFEARRGEDRPAAHVGNQNSGNIGFSFIGNYENQQVPDVQIEAAARIMGWALRTHTGVRPTREFIKGHQEWPGQNTACPGRNLLPRLDELIAKALGGEGPGPDPDPDPPAGTVSFSVAWGRAPADRDGDGVVDVLPDETLQAVITVRNGTAGPLRGVRLGYQLPAPLRGLDYTIQTDAPAFDGRSFMINDADAAPENPPKDALGAQGELVLYAFAAGETKRILVELAPGAYTASRRRALRAWITQIDGLYRHPDYGARPALNPQGLDLRGERPLDAVHPAAWTFEDPNPAEGWLACGNDPAPSWLRLGEGRLGLQSAIGPCAVSAPWTAIDASAWDSVALSLRSTAGPQDLRLFWAAEGADFEDARSRVFRVPGDGAWRIWRLPLAGAPGWQGTITGLRLQAAVAFPEGRPPAPGWTEIDALWAQSDARRASASEATPYGGEPAELIANPGPTPRPDPTPQPEPDPTPGPDGRRDAGVGADGGQGGQARGDGGDSGCAAAPTRGAGDPLGLLLGALLLAAVRRRR